jgi:3-dehydroquinate dehydratase-2
MILIVNGPNLNLLGEREPEIYGRTTLAEIEALVREACKAWGLSVKAFQSNHEGALIDFLQEHRKSAAGIVINPGALTHSSVALHDCLKAISAPAVEVHISNLHAREEWRRRSLVAPA